MTEYIALVIIVHLSLFVLDVPPLNSNVQTSKQTENDLPEGERQRERPLLFIYRHIEGNGEMEGT